MAIMFRSRFAKQSGDAEQTLAALGRAQAIVEFSPDGTIIHANDMFLTILGYDRDEIVGQPGKVLVPADKATIEAYETLWGDLRVGKACTKDFRRLAKNGEEVWLHASYSPVTDAAGKVCKVVKVAADITGEKLRQADTETILQSIDRTQAVIEFEPDGTIIRANDNFLRTMGYRAEEIVGKHHRMFVDPEDAKKSDYTEFWQALRRGEPKRAEFRRIAKTGREICLRASYNPVVNAEGRVIKVVKLASDITAVVQRRQEVGGVVASSSDTLQIVNDIVAATTQLASSIEDIARSMEAANQEVGSVGEVIKAADGTASELESRGTAMSKIVSVIDDIAEQINLLALNATIEAARAGDAGRGFAVVAGEVKALASQVAKATKDISSEISGMQNISQQVVGHFGKINEGANRVRDNVATVGGAIEEQATVAREIDSRAKKASDAVNAARSGMERIVEALSA